MKGILCFAVRSQAVFGRKEVVSRVAQVEGKAKKCRAGKGLFSLGIEEELLTLSWSRGLS
jgi:hypothetical protein